MMELIERLDFLFMKGAIFINGHLPKVSVEDWRAFLVVFTVIFTIVFSINMLALLRPFFSAIWIYPIFSLNFPGAALTHGLMFGFVIAWVVAIAPNKGMETAEIVLSFVVIPVLFVLSMLMSKRNIRIVREGRAALQGNEAQQAQQGNEAIPPDKKFDKSFYDAGTGFSAEQIAQLKQDEKDGWFEI